MAVDVDSFLLGAASTLLGALIGLLVTAWRTRNPRWLREMRRTVKQTERAVNALRQAQEAKVG